MWKYCTRLIVPELDSHVRQLLGRALNCNFQDLRTYASVSVLRSTQKYGYQHYNVPNKWSVQP